MQCRYISIYSILNNKYFITLSPESVQQHFNECNCQVITLNIDY